MKQILIIQLRKNGDILASSALLHSLKQKYPEASFSILVYKEFYSAVKALKYLSHIYTVDRQEIVTFKKAALFSEAHGLNAFYKLMQELKGHHWDSVIDLSYTLMTTYIMAYLNPSHFYGLKCTEKGRYQYSDLFVMAFNEVVSSYSFTPLHYIDCFHKICKIPHIDDEVKVISNPLFNKEAYEKMNQLRKEKGAHKKIIGLQLKAGGIDRDLSLPLAIDFLKMLFKSNDYYPVLLVAPLEKEHEMASELNRHFNNEIVSIESDFIGLPSVVMNLDLLVTPDTAIKHMADAVMTPVIEISVGKAPFRKQGTYRPNNLVLKTQKELEASDIFEALQYFYNLRSRSSLCLSEGVVLYQVLYDEFGISYDPIAGEVNRFHELSVILSRYYFQLLLSHNEDGYLRRSVRSFSKDEIFAWVGQEKYYIGEAVRKLLQTLTLLRSMKNESKNNREFVTCLGQLLAFCDVNSLVAIPCSLFRGRMEMLECQSPEDSIKELAQILTELKKSLQSLTSLLTSLTTLDHLYYRGGEELIHNI